MWRRRADRPLVFAHRGASGYLPEHTLEAYTLAVAQGADHIEPDVVATRDGALICLHDVHLERVTDASAVYPDRARSDGRWYAVDFTLAELRSLQVTAPGRHDLAGCRIPTLDEMVGLVQHLGARLGRAVGIVPELKQPRFHRAAGVPLEARFVECMRAHGYTGDDPLCVVQCFEAETLQLLRDELDCQLPNLYLLGRAAPTAAELDGAARFADALGPHRSAVEADGGALVRAALERGLAVVPYTFGDEVAEMRRHFHELGVAALFTDFPDVGVRARTR